MFNRYNIGVLERNTGCILYLSSLHFWFFFLGRGEGGVGGERCGGWWSGFVIRKPTSFS